MRGRQTLFSCTWSTRSGHLRNTFSSRHTDGKDLATARAPRELLRYRGASRGGCTGRRRSCTRSSPQRATEHQGTPGEPRVRRRRHQRPQTPSKRTVNDAATPGGGKREAGRPEAAVAPPQDGGVRAGAEAGAQAPWRSRRRPRRHMAAAEVTGRPARPAQAAGDSPLPPRCPARSPWRVAAGRAAGMKARRKPGCRGCGAAAGRGRRLPQRRGGRRALLHAGRRAGRARPREKAAPWAAPRSGVRRRCGSSA